MPSTTSQILRQSGATTVLRPGAEARTPFGTPFFKLVIDPDPDTGTFVKRRLDTRMREEIRAWEKLQRTGKLPENRAYAAVLQENGFADDNDYGNFDNASAVDTPTAEGVVDGGFVVGGEGYPTYFVPDVDGPGDGDSAVTIVPDGDYEERLWPHTSSIGSDSDIDYILDGFVVIDKADATGSVFLMNNTRLCGAEGLRASGRASLADFAHELNQPIVGFGGLDSEDVDMDMGRLEQGVGLESLEVSRS